MKYIHLYLCVCVCACVLTCFLDIRSQLKIFTAELAVNFVSLEPQQHEFLQENSSAG